MSPVVEESPRSLRFRQRPSKAPRYSPKRVIPSILMHTEAAESAGKMKTSQCNEKLARKWPLSVAASQAAEKVGSGKVLVAQPLLAVRFPRLSCIRDAINRENRTARSGCATFFRSLFSRDIRRLDY
jgi:hypothetical protein